MTKEIIEKYIQFGIENGYSLKAFINENQIIVNELGEVFMDLVNEINPNLYQIITSKEFIEAVARGLSFESEEGFSEDVYIEQITINQAIAIRDGKLEEFILNLIK